MKTLKFEHQLAELIQNGQKTSTWRLYDDKDISVNDTIELIDKVEPGKPATWKVIGLARVDSIIQKRMSDLQRSDYDGHEQFSSTADMFETYRRYYGPQVDENTAVKIISFALLPDAQQAAKIVVESTSTLTEANMYADGGSRGNPGPSASGFAIMDMDNRIVVKKGVYLGVTTNNQAEYQALKLGLEEALKMGIREVHVYMDSLLVINQMLGTFKIKNRELWPVHASVAALVPHFEHVSFTQVPRELNKLADKAVNEVLDQAIKH